MQEWLNNQHEHPQIGMDHPPEQHTVPIAGTRDARNDVLLPFHVSHEPPIVRRR
jgi:hypothetical protein